MHPQRALLLLALLICGCRCSGPQPLAESSAAGGQLGGDRPALLFAPADPPAQPMPLVLALHGYGDRASNFVDYLGYDRLARREGFLLIVPDGTPDRHGSRYWNAGTACCNFFGGRVDDVAYLQGLIRQARARFRIDPSRVYVIGLSNGGFMAYRLACEDAGELAAIISIAGAADPDPQRCSPSSPVSVLQIHGDDDAVVLYRGGTNLLELGGSAYPGAAGSVERWASHDGCRAELVREPEMLDVDRGLPGTETEVRHAAGCPAGVDVALWTVRGGAHVPHLSETFLTRSWAWLRAHPKVTR